MNSDTGLKWPRQTRSFLRSFQTQHNVGINHGKSFLNVVQNRYEQAYLAELVSVSIIIIGFVTSCKFLNLSYYRINASSYSFVGIASWFIARNTLLYEDASVQSTVSTHKTSPKGWFHRIQPARTVFRCAALFCAGGSSGELICIIIAQTIAIMLLSLYQIRNHSHTARIHQITI
jgi:hypothetical protein